MGNDNKPRRKQFEMPPASLLRCNCLFWHHCHGQNQCAPWTSNMFFSSFSSSPLGCVVTVTGRLTFVSNKSMEIEVLVDATSLVEAEKGKYRAVSAFFTFISLDKHNRPLPVPPLKVCTIMCLSFFLSFFLSTFTYMHEIQYTCVSHWDLQKCLLCHDLNPKGCRLFWI